MLEIFTVALIIGIAALGSVLSIYGLRETAAMLKELLDITLSMPVNITRDIYESLAAGEFLTLLLLLF